MAYRITLLPGDGIGPDITEATIRVLTGTGIHFDWDRQVAGLEAIERFKDPLPTHVIDSIQSTHLALKGPLTTPVGKGFRSINVALRKEFDLYINLRPARSMEGVKTRYENVDLIVFRENTEEFYAGIEHYIDTRKSAAETIGVVTRTGSERILRAAFEYAKSHGRRRVTIVHKANILKYTGGLFLEVGHEIARHFPELETNDRIIDNMAMQLVVNPNQFDVIVTTNLFGDILSDLCSGLVGGLGLAPGANIGADVAIFEPVHGSAPDIAGKNIANPAAMILAGAMMLDHLGETAAANRVRHAVAVVVNEGRHVTRDLKPGSTVTTTEMADAIVAAM